MDYRTLGNSDLRVSRLAFGCWGITSDFHWGERDEQASVDAIEAALDAGVNFFDTAEVYGDGRSEELLGQVLSRRRDQVVIASKIHPRSMRPDQVAEACERSLRRLNTDYLDLLQTHWTDPQVPIAETWEALLKLKEQGKVRHVGVCNAGTSDLADVCALQAPVSNQLPYNLLWRAIEDAILPACRERNISVLAYSPLMHGLLADKYRSAAEVPDGRARSRHFSGKRPLARHGEPGCEAETFAAIERIRAIAREAGRPMADLALNWVATQPGVDCVIVGVANAAQLAENVRFLERGLEPDLREALTRATDDLRRALGPNPDMWQTASESRYR